MIAASTDWLVGVEVYTSVDAALDLVESVIPGTWWFMSRGRQHDAEPLFGVELIAEGDVSGESIGHGEGATLPEAIVNALLTVLAVLEARDGATRN